jgi:murein DD-endopeptidase MepM/ murein hydrolase activator NlpD
VNVRKTKPSISCATCGHVFDDGEERLLLARDWGTHDLFCSETCLRGAVREGYKAQAATQVRWLLRVALVVLAVAGLKTLWQLYQRWQPQTISFEPAAERLRPTAPPTRSMSGPTLGPLWPPSDEEWIALFGRAEWVYPLPGPMRREPVNDRRIFGAAASHERLSVCRPSGHCGVDLGGQLWGEHVLAAQDGVVDRIQRDGSDDAGGAYVRLAHFGGYVFTQYFHLAAIPRTMARGSVVKAGDVIGLVGDTGSGKQTRHLTFTLSVQPSRNFSEIYWDPAPWMADWPLHVPAHGTVAGLAPERKTEVHASVRRRGEPRPPLSGR